MSKTLTWILVAVLAVAWFAFKAWEKNQNNSGATSSSQQQVVEAEPVPAEPVEETYSFSRGQVEDFVRQTLLERTEYRFLTGCPNGLQGVDGSSMTCVACPEDYAAADSSGWLTLAGSGPFRCDAAGGGWEYEVQISYGNLEFMGDSIRNLR